MKLKIGNVTLENNLVLAPMAGVTALLRGVQRSGSYQRPADVV